MENSDKKNLWSWIKKNSRLMKIFFFSLLIVFLIVLAFCRENLSLYLGDCIYFVTDSCRYFERRVRSLMDIIWQYKGCFLFLFSFSLMLYYLFPFENLRMGHFYRSSNRNRALFLLGLMSFLMYIGYGIARFNEEVPFLKSEIIPDTLLIAFLALPTAWGLWIWRNKDKTRALENEEKSLTLEKSKSEYDIFFRLIEIVTDRNALLSLRIVAISGLVNGYLLKEHNLQKMCETFLRFFLNQIQKERKELNPDSAKEEIDQLREQIICSLLSYYASKSEEVRELDFSDYKFPTLYNLSNMTFYSCEFDNSEMYLSELDNVVFCCCTFKNFTFQYMSLNYVKFLSCRDTVSFEKIFDSKFQSVRFEDSVIEIKELTDSTFNSCELKDTILSPEQYKSYFRVV